MSSSSSSSSSSSASSSKARAPCLSNLTKNSSSSSCQITRAVQTMSTFHNTSPSATFRKYFYSPQHFPKILGCIMMASGIAGYACCGVWYGKKMEDRRRIYTEAYHNNGNGEQQQINNGDGEQHKMMNKNGEDSGDNANLAALARKMTHRLAASSSSSGHHVTTTTITSSVPTPVLQRQVTKFW